MIVTLPADANDQFARLAVAEARRHPARTPAKRAAGHLYAALVTTTSIDGARQAVRTFGDEATQDAALHLLSHLAAMVARHASPQENGGNP